MTRQTLYLCLFLPIIVTVRSRVVNGEILATSFIAKVGIASLALWLVALLFAGFSVCLSHPFRRYGGLGKVH